jgi:diguanylate cyclase (GGDEF)-like protein/putative nucleotidyltransferase with HDIG domain
MLDNDKNKDLQINQILQMVKLTSLIFSGIAFFQYYFEGKKIEVVSGANDLIVLLVLFIILSVYVFWNFIQTKKRDNRFIATWVEPFIFLGISLLLVMLTGTYQSDYKFLFLFVIVSTTIECGMKTGLIISGISSAIILSIDLIFAPKTASNIYFESDLVLSCTFILISWTIGFFVKLEDQHIASLKELANIDGLTGLHNHRYFYDCLNRKTNECKVKGTSLALLFIDIDYFKYYNDIHGHQKGDNVLKEISNILKINTRENDIVSRYGGEEFAIILPNTSEQEAREIGERLRFEIQNKYFVGQEYLPNKNLTISIGVSVFPSKAKSEVEIVKYADEALYRAKFLRKNRVESYFSILDDLQNDIGEDDKEIIASIRTLIAVINARDKYTFKHVERVVSYCTLMADKLNFDEHKKKIFIYAAYMHDIGKINISQDILIKSTHLTDEEWGILKDHPKNGAEIIKNVLSLKEVVPIILQHHERYDGTGYPHELKGNDISYLARILTVIDSFDAMTSNRPYQNKKTFPQAIDELVRCSGSQFDPEIVCTFIRIIKDNFADVNIDAAKETESIY